MKIFFSKSLWQLYTKQLLLLISVSLYVFVVPLFDSSYTNLLSFILILTILAQSTFALGKSRKNFLVLIVVVWLIQLVAQFSNLPLLNHVSKFTTNLFFIYIVLRLIGEILKTKNVSGITILEAITGYLLFGIAYSGFVSFVVALDPASFRPEILSLNEIKYFTFVTFTTLGYGDIAPVSQMAKSLALAISISGQFYVGVIVAILVGKYASQRH